MQTQLVMTFTPDETERIMMLAKANGYDDAEAFIRALVDQAEDDNDPAYADPRLALEHALQDYKAGRVLPVSMLWEALRSDATE